MDISPEYLGVGYIIGPRIAGVIFEPKPWQSYYASYSTSFNPSLEQLVNTTGTSQPLPPEQNQSFEIGVKYDLLHGNLGTSISMKQNVLTIIGQRLPATLELAIFALTMAVVWGGFIALVSTAWRGIASLSERPTSARSLRSAVSASS